MKKDSMRHRVYYFHNFHNNSNHMHHFCVVIISITYVQWRMRQTAGEETATSKNVKNENSQQIMTLYYAIRAHEIANWNIWAKSAQYGEIHKVKYRDGIQNFPFRNKLVC